MKRLLFSLFLACISIPLGAQFPYQGNLKYWDEGPLDLFDLRVTADPIVKTTAGQIATGFKPRSVSVKSGNLRISGYSVKGYLDKDDSWLALDANVDLLLRHAQNLFDLAEFYARCYEADLNKGNNNIGSYYDRAFRAANGDYTSDSAEGRDSTEVYRFASNIAKKLDNNPRKPLEEYAEIPFNSKRFLIMDGSWSFGLSNEVFLGPIGQAIPMVPQLLVGMNIINSDKTEFSAEFTCGFSGRLREPYTPARFESGIRARSGSIGLTIGQRVLDNTSWAIVPFVGFSWAELTQFHKDPTTGETYDVGDNGFKASIGSAFNYKTSRTLYLPSNNYSESALGLKVYASYFQFPHIGNVFTINFGVYFAIQTYELER